LANDIVINVDGKANGKVETKVLDAARYVNPLGNNVGKRTNGLFEQLIYDIVGGKSGKNVKLLDAQLRMDAEVYASDGIEVTAQN
jgi:hypothetical protein